MKKSLLLIVPALLCLTGCETFKVGLDQTSEHKSGLDKSISGQADNDGFRPYSLFGGDTFSTDDTESGELTFGNFTDSFSDIKDLETINSYIIPSADNFFTGVEGPQNVGVKEEDGFFLGADSKYSDGVLTFVFTKDIKYVAITATPYYYIDRSWNGEDPVVDEEAAISVNDSLYILLDSSIDQETNSVKETVCKYNVSNKVEDKNKVSLRVKQRRVFLRKITLYY